MQTVGILRLCMRTGPSFECWMGLVWGWAEHFILSVSTGLHFRTGEDL